MDVDCEFNAFLIMFFYCHALSITNYVESDDYWFKLELTIGLSFSSDTNLLSNLCCLVYSIYQFKNI